MENKTPSTGGVNEDDAKSAREKTENLPADLDAQAGTADSAAAIGEWIEKNQAAHPINQARQAYGLSLLPYLDAEPVDDAPVKFPAKIPNLESENLCRRFDGYLRGWFRNNIPCVLAAEFKRRFSKRTGYSWRHVDDVFPLFQKWSTNFRFKRTRLGRSTCIVITPRLRSLVLTTAEVRRRLAGSICAYVKTAGAVAVNRKFLEGFHARSGLPPEQIFYAWRTLRGIDGLICQWQGRGNQRKFYVQAPGRAAEKTRKRQFGGRSRVRFSHPEIASGISPPTGGNDLKTTEATPPGFPDKSSGSLRSQPSALENRPRGSAAPTRARCDNSNRAGSTYSADDQGQSSQGPPGEIRSKPAGNDHASHRWRATRLPLQVCNRWISAKRFRGKANFLVFGPLFHSHLGRGRVRFRAPHALNYAEDALRAGYLDADICAAYRAGLEQSQAAAVREWEANEAARDRMGFVWRELGPREPSQTISIAWKMLRTDRRTDEERWQAIFRGAVTPQLRAIGSAPGQLRYRGEPPRPPAPKPALTPAGEAIEQRRKLRLPDQMPGVAKLSRRDHATFEGYLKERGLTLDTLLRLSRAEQSRFVREAIAWKKNRADNS